MSSHTHGHLTGWPHSCSEHPQTPQLMQGHHAGASVSPESREDALAPLLPTVSGPLSSDSDSREAVTACAFALLPGAAHCALRLPAPQTLMTAVIRGDFSRLLVLGEGMRTPARCLELNSLWLPPPAPLPYAGPGTPGSASHSQPSLTLPSYRKSIGEPSKSHVEGFGFFSFSHSPWGEQAQGAPCPPSLLRCSSVEPCSNGFAQPLPGCN